MNTALTILASTSPRRRSMLSAVIPDLLFYDFPLPGEVIPSKGNITSVALALAHTKLCAVQSMGIEAPIRFIITADTLVTHKQTIYGKPRGLDEARQMLLGHLARTHRVVSAAWLFDRQSGKEYCVTEAATIQFKPPSEKIQAAIDDYLLLSPPEGPLDKAGAYGIQEPLVRNNLIASIEGSHDAIVGFPLSRFLVLYQSLL